MVMAKDCPGHLSNAPIACPPGYMICSGGRDPLGCPINDTCVSIRGIVYEIGK